MSYTQLYYHVVLRTKYSEKTISQPPASQLYKYIWGIINQKNCKLYRINGMEDHIHILLSIHPTISLAALVKTIKVASTLWMKSTPDFANFRGWCEGYAAFTCSFRDKRKVIDYIKNQQVHHKKERLQEEFIRILKEEGLDFDKRYIG